MESHQSVMERRRAVSDWLENVVTENVTEDLVPQVCAGNVFTLLTGHCVLKACEQAQEAGRFFFFFFSKCTTSFNKILLNMWQKNWFFFIYTIGTCIDSFHRLDSTHLPVYSNPDHD